MAGVQEIISNEDYNNIRSKVSLVLGTGVATSGYGQTVQSISVAANQQITKNQWDNLRFDLINTLLHQTGELPPLVQIQTTDPIRYGATHPNFQYNTFADQAVANKFAVGEGQYILTSDGTMTANRSTSWSNSVFSDLTVTFGTVDEARFFFNSGGKLRFTSSRSGGSTTAQNSSWSSLLESAGQFEFGGNTTGINFYGLTDIFQNLYTISASASYSGNTYRIQARCNVADNSAGTANTLFFRFTWADPYTDPGPFVPPPDAVDGTLTISVVELKASGVLQPSGDFEIESPTYSFSSITGT